MNLDIAPGRPDDPNGRRRMRSQRRLDNERTIDNERTVNGEHLAYEVGAFRPGTPISQAVLRRYLLTRALGSSVRNAFQWAGVGLVLLAVASWWGGFRVLAVLIGLLGLGVLLVRVMLSALGRRLSGAALLGADEHRVERLVGQTRRGLRHELHRVGLPGAPWGPLVIAFRLTRRRRRAEVLAKLAAVDLAAVVPQSRVDELHLVLGGRA